MAQHSFSTEAGDSTADYQDTMGLYQDEINRLDLENKMLREQIQQVQSPSAADPAIIAEIEKNYELRLQTLTADLAEREENISFLLDQLNYFEELDKSHRQEFEEIDKMLSDMEEANAVTLSDNAAAAAAAASGGDISSVRQELHSTQRALDALQKQNDLLRGQMESQKQQVESQKQQIDSLKQTFQQEKSAWQEERSSFQSQAAAEVQAHVSAASDEADTSAALQSLSQQVEQLTAENAELAQNNAELQSHLQQYQVHCQQLTETIGAANSHIASITEAHAAALAEAMAGQSNAFADSNAAAAADSQSIRRLGELEMEARVLHVQKSQLETEVERLQTQMQEILADRGDGDRDRDGESEQTAQLLQAKEDEIRRLRDTCLQLSQASDQVSDFESIREDFDKVKSQLGEAQDELKRVQEQSQRDKEKHLAEIVALRAQHARESIQAQRNMESAAPAPAPAPAPTPANAAAGVGAGASIAPSGRDTSIDERIRAFRQHLQEVHIREEEERQRNSFAGRLSKVWMKSRPKP